MKLVEVVNSQDPRPVKKCPICGKPTRVTKERGRMCHKCSILPKWKQDEIKYNRVHHKGSVRATSGGLPSLGKRK